MCDVRARVTVEDARKFDPFIVSVCEVEPTGALEGEMVEIEG